jgi:hypothetical protein
LLGEHGFAATIAAPTGSDVIAGSPGLGAVPVEEATGMPSAGISA